jgi:WD40 repeat protein
MGEIFISHSSADQAAAATVAEALRHGGHNVFLDSDRNDGIAPGDVWSRTLFHELRVCDAVLFLNSTASQGSKWCHTELAVAGDLGKRTYWLDLAARLEPHPIVQSVHGIRFGTSLGESTEVLLSALRRDGLADRSVSRWDERRAPYPGLEALDMEDAGVFFGREAEVNRLVERVTGPLGQLDGDLVVVVGPSGAGKSSLVQAGLAARLEAPQFAWAVVRPFEPGAQPLDRLVKRLADLGGGQLSEVDCREQLLASGLAAVAEWLIEHSGARAKRLLVVVDQAEQLETVAQPAEREAFLRLLAPAMGAGSPVTAVMTVRSDRFDEVQRLPFIGPIIHESFVVAPMDRNQLGAIIEGPARRADLSFDPGLVVRLIDDAMQGRSGEAVDSLPLLAFTLREMYDLAVKQRRRTITEADYEHVGRIEGAIARRAKAAESLLAPDAHAVLERLLPRFVTLSEERLPAGRPVVREQLSEAEEDVVQKLEDQRLLTGASDSVRLAHERLIIAWPTLAQAVADRREDLLLQARLERQANDWKDTAGGVLGREALGSALAWLERAGPAIVQGVVGEYVRKSKEAASRRRRLRTGALSVIVMLLVVSVVLSVLAVTSRDQAITEAHESQSVAMAAEASNALALGNVPLGMLLSIEARERADTSQAVSAVASAAAEPLLYAASGSVVNSVAFSPDGNVLASGDSAGYVVLYNLASGTTTTLYNGSYVNSVAFSPDGNMLASGDSAGEVKLYGLESNKRNEFNRDLGVRRWAGDLSPVDAVAFSPDGKTLASVHFSGYVDLYNLESGKETTLNDVSPVDAVAFSPDGNMLASGDGAGQVLLYDLASGKTTTLNDGSQVFTVDFSPDGKTLASGDKAGQVQLYDLASGKTTTLNDGSIVKSVAFSPDGNMLASGDGAGQVQLYDLASGKTTTLNDGSQVLTVAFSPDGKTLATADIYGQVLLYNLARIPFNDGSQVLTVAFSPDGRALASGDQYGQVLLYDMASGKTTTLNDGSQVLAVAFRPHGETLASGDVAGNLSFFGLHSGKTTTVGYPYEILSIDSIAFSPDGRMLASANDFEVMLYNMASGKSTILNPNGDRYIVNSIAYSSDGKTLASGDDGDKIVLYDLKNGKTTTLNDGKVVKSVAFSPDGKTLASGDQDGQVLLYDMASGKTTTLNDGSAVYSVAFSPDGKTLASGDQAGQVVFLESSVWASTFAQVQQQLCHELGDADMTRAQWAAYVPDQKYQRTCP